MGHEKWSIWIDGKKLAKVDKERVYEYVFSPLTKAYWQKKHSLTPSLITSINWEACEDAMGRLPFGKKRWLLKHATGFGGVGRREFLRGNQDHADCPRCGDPNESTRHVVECKVTGADLTFTLVFQNLTAHLTKIETTPLIIIAILTRIRQFGESMETTTFLDSGNATYTAPINNNTMHPRQAANAELIKAQLRDLYRRGPDSLLFINRQLF